MNEEDLRDSGANKRFQWRSAEPLDSAHDRQGHEALWIMSVRCLLVIHEHELRLQRIPKHLFPKDQLSI
jgi:hypothetical protein